jgi:outer membrane protein assembly factor BamB
MDGRIAVSLGTSRIALLDPRTGADLSSWSLPAAAQGELASNSRTLVTALEDGSIAALDVKSMSTRWRTKPGEFGTSLLMTESGVLALADDGQVALLDLENGKAKWQRELKGTPLARPTANREALAVSFDDEIVALSLATGEDTLRIKRPEAAWAGAACMLGDYLAAPTRSAETLIYSLQSASPRFALASERAQSVCGDRRSDTLQAAGKKLRVYRAMP